MEFLILAAVLASIGYISHNVSVDQSGAFSANTEADDESANFRRSWSFSEDDTSSIGLSNDALDSSNMFSSSSNDEHVNIWTDPSYSWMEGNLYHSDTSSHFDYSHTSAFDSSDLFTSSSFSSSSSFSEW